MNPSHTGAARYLATSRETRKGTSNIAVPIAMDRERPRLEQGAGWPAGGNVLRPSPAAVAPPAAPASPAGPAHPAPARPAPPARPAQTEIRSAPSKIAGHIVANDQA